MYTNIFSNQVKYFDTPFIHCPSESNIRSRFYFLMVRQLQLSTDWLPLIPQRQIIKKFRTQLQDLFAKQKNPKNKTGPIYVHWLANWARIQYKVSTICFDEISYWNTVPLRTFLPVHSLQRSTHLPWNTHSNFLALVPKRLVKDLPHLLMVPPPRVIFHTLPAVLTRKLYCHK